MNLFPHLDLVAIREEIESLTNVGLSIAYHADADGVISAALLAQLVDWNIDGFASVSTEDLSLAPLATWAAARRVQNLVTLDINVWSAPGGLAAVADAVGAQVLVVDDHFGEVGASPDNVIFIKLLPNGPRVDRRDQIRPAFMFADAILRQTTALRPGVDAFLALAGLYGEGVDHLFTLEDLTARKKVHSAARAFGRGLTAFLLAEQKGVDDDRLVRALVELVDQRPASEDIEAAARRVTESVAGKEVFKASDVVARLVREQAGVVESGVPWFAMAGLGVYLIEVGSAARIVNLVASEARNRIASGITIAFQLRPRGCVVELRRTRNLEKPDLARLLLDMDATLFVARGGHPMAAGATVAPTKEEVFFAELRAKLEHEVAAP